MTATSLSLSNFDLSSAKVASPIPKKGSVTKSIQLPPSFPEATLFALLKSLFGRPKGVMSLALGSHGDSDAPFKYEYFIELPDSSQLSIMRSWLSLEVRRFGGTLTSEEVIKMFTFNFELHKDRLKKTFEELEPYRLVINPHHRHRRMMSYFDKELQRIRVKEIEVPQSLISKKGDHEKHAKDVHRYMNEMEHQNCIATALVMESAYTAESLLNLFIAVLHNQTLADNKTILQEALRETWKDKILRLPLHCKEITKVPRETDQEIKDIETVFKLRNKIAHSYPDPNDLCVANIWFDDKIPLLPKSESYIPYQCGVDSVLPTKKEALTCPPKVTAFIKYLLSLVNEKVRDEIEFISETNPLGFSDKTGRFGIPFGKSLIMTAFIAQQ